MDWDELDAKAQELWRNTPGGPKNRWNTSKWEDLNTNARVKWRRRVREMMRE